MDPVNRGENFMTAFLVRGAVGAVIDGGGRQVSRLREMQAPVFTRAISPRGFLERYMPWTITSR